MIVVGDHLEQDFLCVLANMLTWSVTGIFNALQSRLMIAILNRNTFTVVAK